MQSSKRFEILKHKAGLFYSFALRSRFSFQGFQWGNVPRFLHSRVPVTFTLLMSRKHDSCKDWLCFRCSGRSFSVQEIRRS